MIIWGITQVMALIIFHIFIDNSISDQTTNFLISGLQATAAIVGLVFFLSILVIEHSASNYSATMLEFFKKDYFVWFSASYGLFTIGFIGSTIMFELNGGLASFVFFLWNLALLGIYLRYTLDMVNPISMNKKVRNVISKTFKKISKTVDRKTDDRIKNNSSLYEGLDSSMIRHKVIDSNKDLLDEVKKYERFLQYVILSTHEKQEYESTNAGLFSYPQIIKQYLQLNPNYFWPVDSFFEMIRERIKEYANEALKKDHPVFLTQIIESSIKVGSELTVIKNLDSPMANNEPLVHWIYALGGIGQKCIPLKNWEGVLQITRALGSLGTESVIKSGKDSQAGNQILEIGTFAIKKMDTFSCITCVNEAFRIFQERAKFLPDIMLDSDMEKLAKYASLAYRLPNAELVGNSFFFEQSGLNPFQYAVNAIRSHNTPFRSFEDELDKDFERVTRIKSLKKHISLIIDFTGKISHWSGNNIILKIIILYLQETEKLFREPFTHEEEIETAIRGLSSRNGKGNDDLAELTIICLENQYNDSAIKCIERISLIAKNMTKNDEHGYDSNRAIRKLNLIGCYLQMKPNNTVLNKIIEKIIEFDVQFEERYNCSTRDELSIDNPSWASDPWDHKYRNLGHNFIKTIMQKNNRIQFEMSIVKAKIKCLKSRSSKNEK